MVDIAIQSKKEILGGVEFELLVDGSLFVASLDDDYYKQLTGGKRSREDLAIASFKFLLEREPKESILKRFDLRLISRYFSEYERVISDIK